MIRTVSKRFFWTRPAHLKVTRMRLWPMTNRIQHNIRQFRYFIWCRTTTLIKKTTTLWFWFFFRSIRVNFVELALTTFLQIPPKFTYKWSDRPTALPSDRPGHKEVTLPRQGNVNFNNGIESWIMKNSERNNGK